MYDGYGCMIGIVTTLNIGQLLSVLIRFILKICVSFVMLFNHELRTPAQVTTNRIKICIFSNLSRPFNLRRGEQSPPKQTIIKSPPKRTISYVYFFMLIRSTGDPPNAERLSTINVTSALPCSLSRS